MNISRTSDFGIPPHSQGASSRAVMPVVLFVTPYSPLRSFEHAANDIARPIVESLGKKCELHVYAPNQSYQRADNGVTYHKGSPIKPNVMRHLGVYPAASRKDWTRRNSEEVRLLSEQLQPDVVHIEYMQPAESVWNESGLKWTVSLHDISTTVFKQRAIAASGAMALYRWLEYFRVARAERRIIRRASHIFTLSDRDAKSVTDRQQPPTVLPLGIVPRDRQWQGHSRDAVFVFAGAMWRDANSSMAIYLIDEVMPKVREAYPEAVLKIVGARPPEALQKRSDGRFVVVTGRVEDIDDEYLKASAVLAPSLIDAGILLKALRALACGCPVITNKTVAEPIGLADGVTGYVSDGVDDIVSSMIRLLENPEEAQSVAAAGREHVREHFSWQKYSEIFVEGISQ